MQQDITKLCCDIAKIAAQLAQVGYADVEVLNQDFDKLDWDNMSLDTSKLIKVFDKIKASNFFDSKPMMEDSNFTLVGDEYCQ